jgi:hypothetical protein
MMRRSRRCPPWVRHEDGQNSDSRGQNVDVENWPCGAGASAALRNVAGVAGCGGEVEDRTGNTRTNDVRESEPKAQEARNTHPNLGPAQSDLEATAARPSNGVRNPVRNEHVLQARQESGGAIETTLRHKRPTRPARSIVTPLSPTRRWATAPATVKLKATIQNIPQPLVSL